MILLYCCSVCICPKLTIQLLTYSLDATFGIRHLHVVLLFTCIAVSYCLRVNLSVAIVAMLDKETANPQYDDFQWNEQTQSLLLSSFFWGYIVTQIPAGQLAEKKGAKFILLISTFISGVISIITPICTSIGGWEALCALRVISGLCQVYKIDQILHEGVANMKASSGCGISFCTYVVVEMDSNI